MPHLSQPLPAGLHDLAAVLPSAEVLIVTDEQLRILAANPQTARLAGYDRADLPGLHLGYLVQEMHRPRLLRSGILALLGHRQQFELSLSTGAGTYRSYRAHLRAVQRGKRRCLFWAFEPAAEEAAASTQPMTVH